MGGGGWVGTTIDRHIINGCPWVQGARDFSAQQKEMTFLSFVMHHNDTSWKLNKSPVSDCM